MDEFEKAGRETWRVVLFVVGMLAMTALASQPVSPLVDTVLRVVVTALLWAVGSTIAIVGVVLAAAMLWALIAPALRWRRGWR